MILPCNVKKIKLKLAKMCHLLESIDYHVLPICRKKKTVASWTENDFI